jgi:predicted transcriptional regulator
MEDDNSQIIGGDIMRLQDIVAILEAEVLVADEDTMEMEISTACGSDLMSDVLAFTKEKTLLLTGLTQPQVIRTAEMMDLNAIIFVRGKRPEPATIQLAREVNIPLLFTPLPLFEACGRLFSHGIRGCLEWRERDD